VSLPRPRRAGPPPVPHGGPDYVELLRLGIHAESLLDFSVSGNPLGASPRALRALGTVEPSRYPDTRAVRLTAALAALHEVTPDGVLVGNGSVELIWLLAQTYLDPGDTALIIGPTFGEYEAATRGRGAEPVLHVACEEEGFRPRLERVLAAVRAVGPRLTFLCNPNNPTGQTLDLDALSSLLDELGEGLLVVDEAYLDFAEGVPSALDLRRDPRVVVIRSLTKNFGLAGLRLGYAVAEPIVVEALSRTRPPWTVNALAQAAGLAALGDEQHLREGRLLARRAKAYLVDGLGRLGLACVPSRTNFWLVEVADAAELRRQLLMRGLLVRDCTSFGLPRHIRLAARPLPECERLLGAIERLVS
jgi:histidinol-phosphate aminotransferase